MPSDSGCSNPSPARAPWYSVPCKRAGRAVSFACQHKPDFFLSYSNYNANLKIQKSQISNLQFTKCPEDSNAEDSSDPMVGNEDPEGDSNRVCRDSPR